MPITLKTTTTSTDWQVIANQELDIQDRVSMGFESMCGLVRLGKKLKLFKQNPVGMVVMIERYIRKNNLGNLGY